MRDINFTFTVKDIYKDFRVALLDAGYEFSYKTPFRKVFVKKGEKEVDYFNGHDALFVSFFPGKEYVNIFYRHDTTQVDVVTTIKGIEHFNQILNCVGLDYYGLKTKKNEKNPIQR